MTRVLSETQQAEAVRALLRLEVGYGFVAEQLEGILGEALSTVMPRDERAAWAMLLDLVGAELLAGGRASARARRRALLARLPEGKLVSLARSTRDAFEWSGRADAGAELDRLAGRRWAAGSDWAEAVAGALGLGACFAGRRISGDVAAAAIALRPPPPLKDFQAALAAELLETLRARQRPYRAMLSLPTGGGKTRTAGEALVQLVVEQRATGLADRYYLWLAQSEELCEQAVLCLQQLWAHQLPGEPVSVHRFFGGRDIAAAAFRPGIVVASIQQVSARLQAPGAVEQTLLAHLGAVVVDEAHRATSASYAKLFATIAEVNPRRERVPVVSLTATPGRARGETNDLIRTFGDRLLLPNLGDAADGAHPLQTFRERGYLSWPDHELVVTDYRVTAAEPVSRAAYEWSDFEARVQRELGRAQRRNRLILQRLLQVPPGVPTLVYACSVEHVRLLHVLLRRAGRTSGYLTGETSRAGRAALVDAFRQNELDFLVNYGVLTTGFDAPKTACIALTRPISSEVLYEQIVGRGLRGPAFGGTARCLILDFEDNYKTFGDQLAYHRFGRFWAQATRVRVELESEVVVRPAVKKRKRGKRIEGPGLFG